MKYVIIGSLGHTGKPLSQALIAAGHDVTILTSKNENVAAIESLGAKAAVGSIEDVPFLAKAFTGADAVYTIIPPKFDATDWKSYIAQIGENYATAMRSAGVKYVVNLSSIGAHLPDGVGPVSGLHRAENALNTLDDVNIIHLRAAYFYPNFFSNIGLIKAAGIVGGNFDVKDNKFPVVDPADVAAVAAEKLLHLNFSGHSYQYVASDEVSTQGVATAIGKAIGRDALSWVPFSNEQAYDGMIQAGFPEEISRNYVEMGQAINSGIMSTDYWEHHPVTLGKTKLADFAETFAAVYKSS